MREVRRRAVVVPCTSQRPLVAVGLLALAASFVAAADPGRDDLEELAAFGKALAAEKCARPVEVKTSFVRTPGDSTLSDEMQSFDCRAFKVAVYRSHRVSPPRESPMSVVLLGAVPRAGRWAVGASASDILATLGAPARRFGENLVYALGNEGRDTLTFEVEGGVVRAVSWYWDVD